MEMPTLRQFIYRREGIKLYRDFLKTLREVENKETRQQTKNWVREEFDRHKNTNDEQFAKMELVRGNTALRELKVSIGLLK